MCNFSKSIGGRQRAKSAQDTIKIMMESDFSSNLTPFLTNIGGLNPRLGGRALPKKYKVTPLAQIFFSALFDPCVPAEYH